MKMLFRLLGTLMLTLLIVGIQVAPVQASSHAQELTYNPEAETYVRAELLADGDVDLVAGGFTTDAERTVRAAFIVSLWQDPAFQAIPFFKLRQVIMVGDLRAEGISIPFNVEFWNCVFDGRIEMSRAKVQSFNMYDSVVKGAVRMGRMEVAGDLALYTTEYQQAVVLFAANIGGNLLAKGSKFNGTVIDEGTSAPFEFWKVQVGQSTEFTDAVILGDAKVDNAKFGVDVKFDKVTFEKKADFPNIEVGTIADFQGANFKSGVNFQGSTFGLDAYFGGAQFNGTAIFSNIRVVNKADFQKAVFQGPVNFESSIMERDVAFTGAVFKGDANFDYLSVARFFDFDGTTLKQRFSFNYPTVGWPYFANATFEGPVNFEGIQASDEFDFTGAVYNYLDEPFTVTLARTGAVVFRNFTATSGLSLEHNQFGDLTISGVEGKDFAFIDLDSTEVNGDLNIENITTLKLFAEGTNVQNTTNFKALTVGDELNMSNASLGFFTMDEKGFWPRGQNSKNNLRGMTYTDIGLVGKELEDNTWSVLLNMVEQSDYSPQAYRTLSQFLTEKGQPDWAADVELKRKERERNILTPYTGPWFWSWFLFIFSGYGQRPDFAFIWSALVILIGTLVFRREEDMVILDTSEAKPPYNPVLSSFAVFLPYIDLGIASKWDPKPDRKFAGIYKHIHRLLGWVLMPIALLTFGGIIS